MKHKWKWMHAVARILTLALLLDAVYIGTNWALIAAVAVLVIRMEWMSSQNKPVLDEIMGITSDMGNVLESLKEREQRTTDTLMACCELLEVLRPTSIVKTKEEILNEQH